MTDAAQQLRLAQRGDAAAFGRIVAAHQGRVRALLRRLCGGDTHRADELAQETFIRAWQALPGFRGEALLATWLYRIAVHTARAEARLGRERVARASQTIDAGDDAAAPPDGAARMERHAAWDRAQDGAQDWSLDLARALVALPEPQREALSLCYFADLAHPDAAAAMGVPLGTLKSHLARGKARLREQLAAWAPAEVKEHRDAARP